MRVKAFVAAIATMAVAATMLAAWQAGPAPATASPLVIVVLGGLIFCAEFYQLSFYHRGHTVALNLLGTFATTLVIAAPGYWVPVVLGVAVLGSNLRRRNALIKTVFNTSQWVFWGACGTLLLRAFPNPSHHLIGVIAVVALFMELGNSLLMVALLVVLRTTRQDVARLLAGMAFSSCAAVMAAILLTAAYLVSAWTLALGFAVTLGLHSFGKAMASLRADHQRLEAMQKATHHLASSMDRQAAIPPFLAEVRAGFEVRSVDLLLLGANGSAAGRHELFRCRLDDEGPEHSAIRTSYPLFSDLGLADATDPVSTDVHAPDCPALSSLGELGHSRVLATPLRSGGRTVGALLLFDRYGVEGFEDGEMAVVSALARELVAFLERAALTAAIDEERRKLADIIDSTSDGIFTLARDGRITSWNSGSAAMTGYTAEEMVGTRHFGLLRPRDVLGRDLQLETWLQSADQTATTELQVLTAEGQPAWLSCSCSRLPGADGNHTLVVVARNVTQVRELERLKDDFVAIVSHELRTPLVPIRGWAQTLLTRGDRLSEDQRRSAVQSILSQSQKLESLVLNILEASRIEAGHADLNDVVDMSAVCARVVDDMLAARPDRTVRFRPPPVPSQVRGSVVWAERAVANLVANAVKYSPDDEPVDVTVDVDLEAGDVMIAVTDRGPGIPEESHERIFARFERLEETRKQTGTGLGLYITRRMARAMGGDVSVSSLPGAGSTFLLRLPLLQSSLELPRPRGERRRAVPDLPLR